MSDGINKKNIKYREIVLENINNVSWNVKMSPYS